MTIEGMMGLFAMGVTCGAVFKLMFDLLFFAVDSLMGILRNIIK